MLGPSSGKGLEFANLLWSECRYDNTRLPRSEEEIRIVGLFDLALYTKPNSIIEIGGLRGLSTEVWLKMMPSGRVVVVDPWPEHEPWPLSFGGAPGAAVYDDFLKRVGHYKNLEIKRGYSPGALNDFADDEFDMCYIDGEHDYNSVVTDLKACQRIVKNGGWLAGHDWGFFDGQVDKAVPDVIGADGIMVFSDTSWLKRNNK